MFGLVTSVMSVVLPLYFILLPTSFLSVQGRIAKDQELKDL